MSAEVTVPELGESIVEATVGQWLKQEGDSVTAGESLVTLETEKVNVEVAAPAAGVLGAIVKHEGETVAVGDVLTTVEEQAQATPDRQAVQVAQSAPTDAQETSAMAAPAAAEAATREAAAGADGVEARAGRTAQSAEAQRNGDVRATPLARRLADEHGVDLSAILGSGAGGRVTHDDVAAYLSRTEQRQVPATQTQNARSDTPSLPPVREASPAQPAPIEDGALTARREERVRMSRRRLTIARRLVEAQQTAAMLTTFNEVDMSAVMELRARRREAFKERHGVSLGFMSFFTRAVIGALKAYPRLNAEIQGDEMVLKRYYDIGIAVATDEGLVVPVVRDANRLTFAEIERQIAELAVKARNGTLGLAELRGGTFTITNGGTFGSLLSTPILNAPQVGILGMHKIEERPVAFKGQVVIHPMMYVALTYDHRIVDGSEAVGFLVHVKELLEDPEILLLEA